MLTNVGMQMQANVFCDKLTMAHCPFFVVEALPVGILYSLFTLNTFNSRFLNASYLILVRNRRILKSSSVQRQILNLKCSIDKRSYPSVLQMRSSGKINNQILGKIEGETIVCSI